MPIDPGTLAKKRLWLRAKDLTGADGSSVTAWPDQSGRSNSPTSFSGTTVKTGATLSSGKAARLASAAINLPTLFTPTVTKTSEVGGEEAIRAFDGSTTSGWTMTSGTTGFIAAQYDSAWAMTQYKIRVRNGVNSRDPKAWTLEGSNDGSSWTTLDTRSAQTFTAGGENSYSFSNSTAYSYYKINVTQVADPATNPGIHIYELTFVGNPLQTGGEMWIVAKLTTENGGSWQFGTSGSQNHYTFAGAVYTDWGNSVRRSYTPSPALASTWRLIRCSLDSSGNLKEFIDETQQFTTVTGVTASWSVTPKLSASWTGDIAEVLIRSTTSTSGEVADLITYFNTEHGLSVPGGSVDSATGVVAASAPAPTVAVAGTVTIAGALSAAAPAPAVAINGAVIVTGVVAASAPTPTVNIAGTADNTSSGVVAAVAPAPTVTIEGVAPETITGVVSATAPSPTLMVSDSVDAAEVAVGATIEVGALTLLNLVALPGVDIPLGLGVESGDSQPVVPLPGISVEIGCTVIARPAEVPAPDPRQQRPQWRYVVTDLANTPLGELTDLEHDPVEDGIGEPGTMSLTLAADSDQHALIKPIERQCQVWDGDTLLLRGPILPGQPSDDGTSMTYKIHDPSWFWRDGRRVITRTPQKNLLHNGDFKAGLTYWTRGYDTDSIPKAAPDVRVVSEDFADDTDGLNPIKAAEITGVESVTESELSSNAVFWPNLATFRPGGVAAIEAVANDMPTTAGLKVTVIGHTANDGTGNGLGLSLRRAQAAAAIIHTKRPSAVITTKGVGFYDPKPGFPVDSQEQRRVVIQYDQTITGESKQWMRQTIEVTQPKVARYPLTLTAAAMLKVADDWSVPDANMVSLKIVARRKSAPTKPWDETLGVGSSSISDTDPVDRWIPQTAEATIPADDRPYLVDVYLYAPAALARYTAVGLFPDEQLYFWGVDQALIFKGVMEHIQKPEYGYADLGVATRTPLTGIKRDREFAFRDLTPADTALDGLMGISRGLEWDTVTTKDRTTATTFYPRQGKAVDYVLVLGGNIVSAVPATTRDVGSAIIAQAQGLGSYRAVAYASDKKAFGGTLIQRVVTAEQDTPLNELRETAKAELVWARSSTPAYWVDVDPDSIEDVLANTAKGDTVRLILDHPTPVDALARIVRRQIHPDSLRLMLAFEEA